MLKAVIFDMDGVLVDSEPVYFEVDKRLLGSFGLKVDNEFLNRYIGVSNKDMMEDIIKRLNIEQSADELTEIKLRLSIKAFNEANLVTIPGVRELIAELTAHNISLAIASSSPRTIIETVINKLNISGFFKIIISGEEVKNGKPAPDIFLKAADLLGVNPNECMVIEDSENGVGAAFAAGIKCIGFANPNSGNQDLSKASAVVDDIRKINYELMLR